MNWEFRILIIIMTKCRDSSFWNDYKQPIFLLLIASTHLSELHHAYGRGRWELLSCWFMTVFFSVTISTLSSSEWRSTGLWWNFSFYPVSASYEWPLLADQGLLKSFPYTTCQIMSFKKEKTTYAKIDAVNGTVLMSRCRWTRDMSSGWNDTLRFHKILQA